MCPISFPLANGDGTPAGIAEYRTVVELGNVAAVVVGRPSQPPCPHADFWHVCGTAAKDIADGAMGASGHAKYRSIAA
jgi:hypothetical protein